MALEFDVFFFSCGETYAEKHLHELRKLIPQAQHIQGYPSTISAWTEAARRSRTTHFFSVDADNLVEPNFSWIVYDFVKDDPRIHVWRCRNPVNGLVYGHGAIKLWSVKNILEEGADRKKTWIDFTCQVSKYGFHIQSEIASLNQYNLSPKETFLSAYKETFKLATGQAKYAKTLVDPNLLHKLCSWAYIGRGAQYGEYSIVGAQRALIDALSLKQILRMHYSPAWRTNLWSGLVELEAELQQNRLKLIDYSFPYFDLSATQSLAIASGETQPPWYKKDELLKSKYTFSTFDPEKNEN